MTFRLEQYDPHAGRTGVVTARMLGDEAMGFVTEGDWVEVNGKSRSGFLHVKEAFNHTSGAKFSRHRSRAYTVMLMVAFAWFALILLWILYGFITHVVLSQ